MRHAESVLFVPIANKDVVEKGEESEKRRERLRSRVEIRGERRGQTTGTTKASRSRSSGDANVFEREGKRGGEFGMW